MGIEYVFTLFLMKASQSTIYSSIQVDVVQLSGPANFTHSHRRSPLLEIDRATAALKEIDNICVAGYFVFHLDD